MDVVLFFFQAFEELEKLLSKRNICVAVREKLTKDSGVAGSDNFNHIVEKLLAKPKAKGMRISVTTISVSSLHICECYYL